MIKKIGIAETFKIEKTTVIFILAGIFWTYESTDRFDIDDTLIDCDAVLTQNFGFSFSYERSEDEMVYDIFIENIHVATLNLLKDGALELNVEDFEPFEIKTSKNAKMLSLGESGKRFVEKCTNGVVTYTRKN